MCIIFVIKNRKLFLILSKVFFFFLGFVLLFFLSKVCKPPAATREHALVPQKRWRYLICAPRARLFSVSRAFHTVENPLFPVLPGWMGSLYCDRPDSQLLCAAEVNGARAQRGSVRVTPKSSTAARSVTKRWVTTRRKYNFDGNIVC